MGPQEEHQCLPQFNCLSLPNGTQKLHFSRLCRYQMSQNAITTKELLTIPIFTTTASRPRHPSLNTGSAIWLNNLKQTGVAYAALLAITIVVHPVQTK